MRRYKCEPYTSHLNNFSQIYGCRDIFKNPFTPPISLRREGVKGSHFRSQKLKFKLTLDLPPPQTHTIKNENRKSHLRKPGKLRL